MKLSQNYRNRQVQQQHEYEQFRRQVLRYGAAFGVVYGGASDHGPGSSFEIAAGEYDGSGQGPTSNIETVNAIDKLAGIAASVQSGVSRFASRVSARLEQRRVISQWLKLSDHVLEDIGLVRSEIETLRDNGGDPEAYIREIRKNRQVSEHKLRLIDCTELGSKTSEDADRFDTSLETELNQAA
jgi:uncharacterized protein YjiS (DUF1127 family)